MNLNEFDKSIRQLRTEKSVLKQLLILENLKTLINKEQTTLKKKL